MSPRRQPLPVPEFVPGRAISRQLSVYILPHHGAPEQAALIAARLHSLSIVGKRKKNREIKKTKP
jgi:hypothetical protein